MGCAAPDCPSFKTCDLSSELLQHKRSIPRTYFGCQSHEIVIYVHLLKRGAIARGHCLAEEPSMLHEREVNERLGVWLKVELTVLPFLSFSSSKPPNLASVRTTSKSSCEYSTSAIVRC